MPKIHRKRNGRTKSKSKSNKCAKMSRRSSRNAKHLAKMLGGGCGCGAASHSITGGASLPPQQLPHMKGGFAPSFSGLHENKFYPLNNFQNDPTMMAAGSRQMSGVEIGMNKTVGGGRKRSAKKQNRRRRTAKKMRGGMSLGGLLSATSGTILGNGMSDNVVVNQGGTSGMVSSYQVLAGNHAPNTAVSQPLTKLYSEVNPPMV